MSSQDVIKSTARKLKYYMEVKRLEDAFDLSGPDKPQRHYPALKPRPTLLYDGLHDRALKHYFRSPEVKKHLAQMNPKTSYIEREDKVRRDVDRYMSKSQFTGQSSHLVRPMASSPKKRRSNFKGGPFLLRSKHGPYLTKGEAQRLINTATKMLVASETIPLENQVVDSKKSSNVYRVRQNGDREMLPFIGGAANSSMKHRPERPKSTYGIRPTRPKSGRPKSAMTGPKATDAHPSTKRYGYDSSGRRVRLHKQPQRHYEASESEVEPDDVSEVSDRSMNMLVPVATSTQNPEWLNIKMSRVSLNDDGPAEEEVYDEEEEEEESVKAADEEDPDLYSIDNTTQTVKEAEMQTVENINSKDTQTRRANTVECLTDPYQADMSMQTDPPPISMSTQTIPPPPSVETQTHSPPPSVEVQTMEMNPSVEVQTLPPPPAVSTQTSTEHPAMSTQTMPESGTQTVNVMSTQTEPKAPEMGTQMTPSASEEEPEDDTFEHLQHGPKIKSGRRTVYEMAIHTGSRLGASTTADIFVILFGEKGNTGKIKLKQSKEGDRMKFQKGQIDVFRVESFFVGRLECVCIGHERKELGCGWFCDKVLIREFDNNVTYEFVCSRWFSAQDDDGRTERTLPVTNVIMEVSSSSESEDDDKRYTSTSAVSDTDRHLSEATGIDNGQSSDYLSARSDGGSSSRASKRRSKKSRKGHTTTGSDSESGESDRRGRSRKKRGDDSSSSSSGTSDSESDSSSDDEPARRGKGRRSHSVNNNNNIRELSDDGIAERENYMIGFKAGLKAREDEIRRQEDERREEEEYMKEEEERLMLQGPSIHECCQTGDLTRVKKLINYSHDVIGTTDERGRTPLHVASSHGRLDLVKWLVMNDASVNELTQTGYSCMHLSSMNGHVQVMKILVALGVDVDCLTVDEQTPLHLAAMNGHIDCCKWLVANNATLDAKDVMGRPPLELTDEYQHQDCAEFLRSCQSELNRSESSLSQIRSRSPSREREVRAGTASGREEEEIKTKQDSTERDESSPSDTTIDKKEKQAVLKRQQSFHQQQKIMNETGMSFLDSIRNSFENEESNDEQLQA